jgi:prepilin-type N-terminal cleavage/methylation domain-containing protein
MDRNRGFTLVELMVVVLIMGVLAAIALAKYNISTHRSHEKEADVALGQLYRMQEVYRSEHGTYAASEAELSGVGYVAPVMKNFQWAGSVQIPQCLISLGSWNNRGVTATGAIENC